MRWQHFVGSLNVKVSCSKEACKSRALLPKRLRNLGSLRIAANYLSPCLSVSLSLCLSVSLSLTPDLPLSLCLDRCRSFPSLPLLVLYRGNEGPIDMPTSAVFALFASLSFLLSLSFSLFPSLSFLLFLSFSLFPSLSFLLSHPTLPLPHLKDLFCLNMMVTSP